MRNVYEASNPTTQCNNVIGPFIEGTECYICGMKIIQKGASNGLSPECEHILPIAQAVMFLNLYGAKFKKNQLFYNPDKLPLEYAWAHRTCNQIKSDDSYISYKQTNPTGSKFIVDDTKLKQFMNKIWNNNRSDSNEFNKILHKNYKTTNNNDTLFIKKQFPVVRKRFEDIIEYLNSFDAPELLILIAATKALEGPMSKEGAELIQTVNLNTKKKEEFEEAKKLAEKEYNKEVDNVISSLKKDYSSNWQIYYKFLGIAANYRSFYSTLYAKLPDNLRDKWNMYINVKLLNLFYESQINAPNQPRKLTLLVKKIEKLSSEDWYNSIQQVEYSLIEEQMIEDMSKFNNILKNANNSNNIRNNISNIRNNISNNNNNIMRNNTRKNGLKRGRNNSTSNTNNYNNNQNENNYNNYENEERNIIIEPATYKRPRVGGKTRKRSK